MTTAPAAGLPPAQGLYDPAHEHDACGVGFVVDIKGRRSHAIVSQALQVLKNLLHRGACGCEVNTGDGAGILIQMPHAFLARECARLGITLPAPGALRRGARLPPPRDGGGGGVPAHPGSASSGEEGQSVLGWRDVPTDSSAVGPSARAVEPDIPAGLRGPGGGRARPRRLRAQALRHPQAGRARGEPDRASPRRSSSICRASAPIPSSTRACSRADQIEGDVPRRHRPPGGLRARPRAPALLHQHVPVVAAGAPVPDDRPQRRDQHAARQHQLDARARGDRPLRRARRRPQQAHAHRAARAAATRRPSTTCSSSSSWPAVPCPSPSS